MDDGYNLIAFSGHLSVAHSCAWCVAQAVMQLLSAGAQNRHVAATKANADSSRSHCVFTCVVESKCTEDGVTSIKTSCLNLVDLAGWSTPLAQVALCPSLWFALLAAQMPCLSFGLLVCICL